MPTSIESLPTDITQLGKVGAVDLAQLRRGWSCGLGKAEGYALSRAIRDRGLVLEGGTSGLVSLSDCIGPAGPISPWVSLGLAAELIQYGQGAQLLAIQSERGVELAIAAAAPPAALPHSQLLPPRDLRGAGALVCVTPWIGFLLSIILQPKDSFPGIAAALVVAAILVVLLILLHPLLVQSRAARDIAVLGGRPPAES